jgi:predicted SnoaL-like aldol condensation-catalyzing enzyme
MTPKQLVSSYMQQVWVEKQIDAVDRHVATDMIQHNPNLPNGLAALKGFLPKLFGELLPRLEWRVVRTIAEGDLVVVHSHAIPEPGALGMSVVDIFRVANERIVEHWDLSHDVPGETASGNTIF